MSTSDLDQDEGFCDSPSRSPLISSLQDSNVLPPEVEEGNIEYKLKLIPDTSDRYQQLVTQMKWRLAEGEGECFYELGVSNNGELVGLTKKELTESLSTLRRMSASIGAEVLVVRERSIEGNERRRRGLLRLKKELKKCKGNEKGVSAEVWEDIQDDSERKSLLVAEALVRKVTTFNHQLLELKVAFLGSSESGKSSLLGVLAHGELDNGKGKARLNLLRHRHELETGRSSSLSYSIIGFSATGTLIQSSSASENSNATSGFDEAQLIDSASKLLLLIDTCGHEKYLKTTITSLTAYNPDYACIIIDGTKGSVDSVTNELCSYATVLNVPVFIVINKIDLAENSDQDNTNLKNTVKNLIELLMLPGSNRVPMIMQQTDDIVVACQQICSNTKITPIFFVSSVTGQGTELLIKFFNLLPHRNLNCHSEVDLNEKVEFNIDEIYSVPDVGTVVGGRLTKGTLTIHSSSEWYSCFVDSNPKMKIGPIDSLNSVFKDVKITSVHRQRVPVKMLYKGQSATLALDNFDRNLVRKGMIITSEPCPTAVWDFEALVWILHAPPSYYLPVYEIQNYERSMDIHRKRKISDSLNKPMDLLESLNKDTPLKYGTLYVGNVRQMSSILGVTQIVKEGPIDSENLKGKVLIETGSRYKVRFRFCRSREYINEGTRLFYKEESESNSKYVYGLKIVGKVVIKAELK